MARFGGRVMGAGMGVILLSTGILWVLKDLGYLPSAISMWALLFIVLGLWWVVSRLWD